MRIQNTSLIGLFLQEMGRLWRVSDCEELVGVTHRRRKKKEREENE